MDIHKKLGYAVIYEQPKNVLITRKVEDLLKKLKKAVEANVKDGEKRIGKAITEYPAILEFKELLVNWYLVRERNGEAIDLLDQIIKDYPDHLSPRIDLAEQYLDAGEVDKVVGLVGSSFDLKDLYSKRSEFYISEVEAMFNIAIQYYIFTSDYATAREKIDLLEEVNPDSIMVDRFLDLCHHYEFGEPVDFDDDDDYEDDLGYFGSFGMDMRTSIKQPATTKVEPPVFNHPEIAMLYDHMTLSKEEQELILNLPRTTLIADLETVLVDSIERYTYFDGLEYTLSNMNFVMHTFLLSRELEAKEMLPTILKVLSQSEEYLEMNFGDLLSETVWHILMVVGVDNLKELGEFAKQPTIYTYAKVLAGETLAQLVLFDINRRDEVLVIFKDIMDYYITADVNEVEIDPTFIAFIISEVGDVKLVELLDQAKQLYDLKYVDLSIGGDYNDLKKVMKGSARERKRDIDTMDSLYALFERNCNGQV